MTAATFTGKLVLVERAEPTKEHTGRNDGAYLVWAESDSQLFGVPLDGLGLSVFGLGSSGRRQIPLLGAAAYRILAVDEPGEWVAEALAAAEREIARVRRGEQRASWVAAVYNDAEATIHLLRKALRPPADPAPRASTPPSRWLPADPHDLETLLVLDILLTRLAASLDAVPARGAQEILAATRDWRTTVEYWTWLSHHGLARESL